MRKFIVLCVVLILTLISPIYAFADDPEESDFSGDRLATEEELQELDVAISETSHTLALLMASGDSVKATDYEQATYNLLSSVFGSSTTSWASIVATRLGYLSTINTSANGIAVKLTQFYNSINPDYDTTGISMYDLGHGILTALTSIDPNDGDLTIIETLVYITSALDDLHTDLTAILNSTYSIDSKLVNINTAIVQFKSDLISAISSLNTDMNTGFTNVNANMALILSKLQVMQDSFDNITWIDDGTSSVLGFSSTIDNAVSGVYDFERGWYNKDKDLYLTITLPSGLNIYKLALNLYTNQNYKNSVINITVYNNDTTSFEPLSYSIIGASSTQTQLYFYNLVGGNTYYFKLDFNVTYRVNQLTSHLYHMSLDSHDAYYYKSYIDFASIRNSFSKFEMLYASDDLIAAKQDQQDYEDQAIQDFTGSGSAAASGQDLGDMKSISGAIKSGLQSGGSVNNALAPFNTNSGFWDWFSQSNYDNINNIPSSGLRGGHNNEPEIIDFYTNNQYTLQGLLSGGGD